MKERSDLSVNFGACCACGKAKPPVRNIYTLQKLAPVAGTGWSCLQCGLPPNGACAAVCDECHESRAELKWAVLGFLADGKRIPIHALSGTFDHNPRFHPELAVLN